MLGYYTQLALKNLKGGKSLTLVIVLIVAVGIGSFVTTLTIFVAMNSDPIPGKSNRLFAIQLEDWISDRGNNRETDQLTVDEATFLLSSGASHRAAAMYATKAVVAPPNPQAHPMEVSVRATSADFFTMFEVPFRFGSPWRIQDDAERNNVVILSTSLNNRLFSGRNSIGSILVLDGKSYIVQGVIDKWNPLPKFFDLHARRGYGEAEDLYLPLSRAISEHMEVSGDVACNGELLPGWEGYLHSDCVWIQMWVELSRAEDRANYLTFLNGLTGRFEAEDALWRPKLSDVGEWLTKNHVVSDDVRLLLVASISFLCVCLVNAAGLMLAKVAGRSNEISVRRALGAARNAIGIQYLVESGVVGVAGGLLGAIFAWIGLLGVKSLLADEFSQLSQMTVSATCTAVALSVLGTISAGVYATWRAVRVEPSLHLKDQ